MLTVDWPHKAQSKAYFPPKGTLHDALFFICLESIWSQWFIIFLVGYAFLIFQDEVSVHQLIKICHIDDGKLYMYVSSVTQTNKKVVPIFMTIKIMSTIGSNTSVETI